MQLILPADILKREKKKNNKGERGSRERDMYQECERSVIPSLGVLLNDLLLSLKLFGKKISLNDMDLTALHLYGVNSLDGTLLLLVGSKGNKSNTLAHAGTSPADLRVENFKVLKDVLHVALLCDERKILNSDGVLGGSTVGVGTGVVSVGNVVGRCRFRTLGTEFRAAAARRRRGVTTTTEVRGVAVVWGRIGSVDDAWPGRKLGEGLSTLDLKIAAIERLSVELLNHLVNLVGILKGYESRALGAIAESEDVYFLNRSHSLDVTSKSQFACLKIKAADEDFFSLILG